MTSKPTQQDAIQLVVRAFKTGSEAIHDLLDDPLGRWALFDFIRRFQGAARDLMDEATSFRIRDYESTARFVPPEVEGVIRVLHDKYPWYERALRIVEIEAARRHEWHSKEGRGSQIPMWCNDAALQILSRMVKEAANECGRAGDPNGTKRLAVKRGRRWDWDDDGLAEFVTTTLEEDPNISELGLARLVAAQVGCGPGAARSALQRLGWRALRPKNP